ncbi:hypothetical protein ACEPPN_009982 [Leptodophora sp. 'Broadleaf-Isolate-01']
MTPATSMSPSEELDVLPATADLSKIPIERLRQVVSDLRTAVSKDQVKNETEKKRLEDANVASKEAESRVHQLELNLQKLYEVKARDLVRIRDLSVKHAGFSTAMFDVLISQLERKQGGSFQQELEAVFAFCRPFVAPTETDEDDESATTLYQDPFSYVEDGFSREFHKLKAKAVRQVRRGRRNRSGVRRTKCTG